MKGNLCDVAVDATMAHINEFITVLSPSGSEETVSSSESESHVGDVCITGDGGAGASGDGQEQGEIAGLAAAPSTIAQEVGSKNKGVTGARHFVPMNSEPLHLRHVVQDRILELAKRLGVGVVRPDEPDSAAGPQQRSKSRRWRNVSAGIYTESRRDQLRADAVAVGHQPKLSFRN